ncbi:hypothetical protein CANMA_005333 [Candida margitis]|uniref:uncharacterized protein n=1 Tax=Candida margitis TaxID=1775924 RepID=UPI0022278649|nr:uncharacterized protein CANMA_005333 [Candida margitis]KAI5950405.1 hypothetical protein CANMA_005333 [Candida margitis]
MVIGIVIALGAIAIERHLEKKKLRNMSAQEREEYERYQSAQEQGGSPPQYSKHYPAPPQYSEQYSDAGYHSRPAKTSNSCRMNYNRGRRMTNKQDKTASPPTSKGNKKGHGAEFVAENKGVSNTPPAYTV